MHYKLHPVFYALAVDLSKQPFTRCRYTAAKLSLFEKSKGLQLLISLQSSKHWKPFVMKARPNFRSICLLMVENEQVNTSFLASNTQLWLVCHSAGSSQSKKGKGAEVQTTPLSKAIKYLNNRWAGKMDRYYRKQFQDWAKCKEFGKVSSCRLVFVLACQISR